MKIKGFNIRSMTTLAIMSSLASIFMLIDFPLTFIAPQFYKLDFSDLPCLIESFAFGPIFGVLSELLKIIIKLLLKPTTTSFVGELSNFLCGISLCIPAGIIYRIDHTKKGALKSLIISSIIYVLLSALINYFFVIPFYSIIFHIPLDTIIELGSKIFPVINSKFLFVAFCTIPFNAIKIILVSILTYVLYKRISPLIKAEI